MERTRLAPSPTGALHLGNARTFLVNWLLARQRGWHILLRIEDLDARRVKPGFDDLIMDDLRWLGIDWDEGPVYQANRHVVYDTAIDRLLASGHAYPCICTRKEVELASSAPHASDGVSIYPGTCRGRFASVAEAAAASGRPVAIRFNTRGATVSYTDEFAGPRQFDVENQLGDFVIRKNDGAAAYQLAVVVDDAQASVTQIIRSDDLQDSTPRQILVYQALGLAEKIPKYFHVPLVIGADGTRLAKRHGDTRIATYRQSSSDAGRVIRLLSRWLAAPETEDVRELIKTFDLSRVSHDPIVLTESDERYLRGD